MSSEDNKQFILASYRSFGARDREKIAAHFAPDADFIAPDFNATAVALGIKSGFKDRAAIVRYLAEDVHRLFPVSKVEITAVVADGDNVVVQQVFEATVCNGRAYKVTQIYWFVVRDGLIRNIRVFFDTAQGLQQLFAGELPRQIV